MMRNKILLKITSLLVLFLFLANDLCYGLAVRPATGDPVAESRIYYVAQHLLEKTRGPGPINFDVFIRGNLPSTGVEKIDTTWSSPPSDLMDKPLVLSLVLRADLISAFKMFRNRQPGKHMDIATGNYEVEDNGAIPIYGEERGSSTIYFHPKIIGMLNDICTYDVWFKYKNAEGRYIDASLASEIFERVAGRAINGNVKNDVISVACWMWFIGSYANPGNSATHDNDALEARINWFFSAEGKAFKLDKEFPGLDEATKQAAIKLALWINHEDYKNRAELRKASKKRGGAGGKTEWEVPAAMLGGHDTSSVIPESLRGGSPFDLMRGDEQLKLSDKPQAGHILSGSASTPTPPEFRDAKMFRFYTDMEYKDLRNPASFINATLIESEDEKEIRTHQALLATELLKLRKVIVPGDKMTFIGTDNKPHTVIYQGIRYIDRDGKEPGEKIQGFFIAYKYPNEEVTKNRPVEQLRCYKIEKEPIVTPTVAAAPTPATFPAPAPEPTVVLAQAARKAEAPAPSDDPSLAIIADVNRYLEMDEATLASRLKGRKCNVASEADRIEKVSALIAAKNGLWPEDQIILEKYPQFTVTFKGVVIKVVKGEVVGVGLRIASADGQIRDIKFQLFTKVKKSAAPARPVADDPEAALARMMPQAPAAPGKPAAQKALPDLRPDGSPRGRPGIGADNVAAFLDSLAPKKAAKPAPKPGGKSRDGKSPEDAMTVIALYFLWNRLEPFTIKDYINAYDCVRKAYPELHLEKLSENRSTVRRDLYYRNIRSLVDRGMIEKFKDGGHLVFALTQLGREEVNRRREISGALADAYVALYLSTKGSQRKIYWNLICRKCVSNHAARQKIRAISVEMGLKPVTGAALMGGDYAAYRNSRRTRIRKEIKRLAIDGPVLSELRMRTLQVFEKQPNGEELRGLRATVRKIRDVEMRNFPKPLVRRDAQGRLSGEHDETRRAIKEHFIPIDHPVTIKEALDMMRATEAIIKRGDQEFMISALRDVPLNKELIAIIEAELKEKGLLLKGKPAAAAPRQTDPRSMEMDDLGLAERSLEVVVLGGVASVEQLTTKTENELLGIRSLGKVALNNIKVRLALKGLYLKGDPNAPTPAAAAPEAAKRKATRAAKPVKAAVPMSEITAMKELDKMTDYLTSMQNVFFGRKSPTIGRVIAHLRSIRRRIYAWNEKEKASGDPKVIDSDTAVSLRVLESYSIRDLIEPVEKMAAISKTPRMAKPVKVAAGWPAAIRALQNAYFYPSSNIKDATGLYGPQTIKDLGVSIPEALFKIVKALRTEKKDLTSPITPDEIIRFLKNSTAEETALAWNGPGGITDHAADCESARDDIWELNARCKTVKRAKEYLKNDTPKGDKIGNIVYQVVMATLNRYSDKPMTRMNTVFNAVTAARSKDGEVTLPLAVPASPRRDRKRRLRPQVDTNAERIAALRVKTTPPGQDDMLKGINFNNIPKDSVSIGQVKKELRDFICYINGLPDDSILKMGEIPPPGFSAGRMVKLASSLIAIWNGLVSQALNINGWKLVPRTTETYVKGDAVPSAMVAAEASARTPMNILISILRSRGWTECTKFDNPGLLLSKYATYRQRGHYIEGLTADEIPGRIHIFVPPGVRVEGSLDFIFFDTKRHTIGNFNGYIKRDNSFHLNGFPRGPYPLEQFSKGWASKDCILLLSRDEGVIMEIKPSKRGSVPILWTLTTEETLARGNPKELWNDIVVEATPSAAPAKGFKAAKPLGDLASHEIVNGLIKLAVYDDDFREELKKSGFVTYDEDNNAYWLGNENNNNISLRDVFDELVRVYTSKYGSGKGLLDNQIDVVKLILANAGVTLNPECDLELCVRYIRNKLCLQIAHVGVDKGTVYAMRAYSNVAGRIIAHERMERAIHRKLIEEKFNTRYPDYKAWRKTSKKIVFGIKGTYNGAPYEIEDLEGTYNEFLQLAHNEAERCFPVADIYRAKGLEELILPKGYPDFFIDPGLFHGSPDSFMLADKPLAASTAPAEGGAAQAQTATGRVAGREELFRTIKDMVDSSSSMKLMGRTRLQFELDNVPADDTKRKEEILQKMGDLEIAIRALEQRIEAAQSLLSKMPTESARASMPEVTHSSDKVAATGQADEFRAGDMQEEFLQPEHVITVLAYSPRLKSRVKMGGGLSYVDYTIAHEELRMARPLLGLPELSPDVKKRMFSRVFGELEEQGLLVHMGTSPYTFKERAISVIAALRESNVKRPGKYSRILDVKETAMKYKVVFTIDKDILLVNPAGALTGILRNDYSEMRYVISPAGSHILFYGRGVHGSCNNPKLLNLENPRASLIPDKARTIKDFSFSPDGSHCGYACREGVKESGFILKLAKDRNPVVQTEEYTANDGGKEWKWNFAFSYDGRIVVINKDLHVPPTGYFLRREGMPLAFISPRYGKTRARFSRDRQDVVLIKGRWREVVRRYPLIAFTTPASAFGSEEAKKAIAISWLLHKRMITAKDLAGALYSAQKAFPGMEFSVAKRQGTAIETAEGSLWGNTASLYNQSLLKPANETSGETIEGVLTSPAKLELIDLQRDILRKELSELAKNGRNDKAIGRIIQALFTKNDKQANIAELNTLAASVSPYDKLAIYAALWCVGYEPEKQIRLMKELFPGISSNSDLNASLAVVLRRNNSSQRVKRVFGYLENATARERLCIEAALLCKGYDCEISIMSKTTKSRGFFKPEGKAAAPELVEPAAAAKAVGSEPGGAEGGTHTGSAGLMRGAKLGDAVPHVLLNTIIRIAMRALKKGRDEFITRDIRDKNLWWFGNEENNTSFRDIFDELVRVRALSHPETTSILENQIAVAKDLLVLSGLALADGWTLDQKFIDYFRNQLGLQVDHIGIGEGRRYAMKAYQKGLARDIVLKHTEIELAMHRAFMAKFLPGDKDGLSIAKYKEWRNSMRLISTGLPQEYGTTLMLGKCGDVDLCVPAGMALSYNTFAQIAHDLAEEHAPVAGIYNGDATMPKEGARSPYCSAKGDVLHSPTAGVSAAKANKVAETARSVARNNMNNIVVAGARAIVRDENGREGSIRILENLVDKADEAAVRGALKELERLFATDKKKILSLGGGNSRGLLFDSAINPVRDVFNRKLRVWDRTLENINPAMQSWYKYKDRKESVKGRKKIEILERYADCKGISADHIKSRSGKFRVYKMKIKNTYVMFEFSKPFSRGNGKQEPIGGCYLIVDGVKCEIREFEEGPSPRVAQHRNRAGPRARAEYGSSPNDADNQFILAKTCLMTHNADWAQYHAGEAIRLLREVGFDDMSGGYPVADMVNEVYVAIEVLNELLNGRGGSVNASDREMTTVLTCLDHDVNGEALKDLLKYTAFAQDARGPESAPAVKVSSAEHLVMLAKRAACQRFLLDLMIGAGSVGEQEDEPKISSDIQKIEDRFAQNLARINSVGVLRNALRSLPESGNEITKRGYYAPFVQQINSRIDELARQILAAGARVLNGEVLSTLDAKVTKALMKITRRASQVPIFDIDGKRLPESCPLDQIRSELNDGTVVATTFELTGAKRAPTGVVNGVMFRRVMPALATAAAPEQTRRPDETFGEAEGKNPEDAWRVIINSPSMQQAIMEKGYFTTSDYREGWKETAKELGFVPKDTPDEKIKVPGNNTIISDLKALSGDKYGNRLSWKFIKRELRFYVSRAYRVELKWLPKASGDRPETVAMPPFFDGETTVSTRDVRSTGKFDTSDRSSDIEPGEEVRPPAFGAEIGESTLPILAGAELFSDTAGGGLEPPARPMSVEEAALRAMHAQNEKTLEENPLIKIISEYIIRGLDKGPGVKKPLSVEDLEAVYKTINLLNDNQMEIYWPQRHALTEEVDKAVEGIGKRHGQRNVMYKPFSGFRDIFNMLKENSDSKAMRIIITDIPTGEDGEAQREELADIIDERPDLFQNVRFLNMEMPDKFEGNAKEQHIAKTVFQADAIMRAILARLYEPNKTPLVEALLRTMLEGTINCSIDDFLRILSEAGDATNLDLSKATDKATFIQRISLALGHAVKIAEKIGERILLDKAFWIAA